MLGVTQRTKAGSLTVLVTALLILTSLAPVTAPSDRGTVDFSTQKAVDIASKGRSSWPADIGMTIGHGLQIAKETLPGIFYLILHGFQPRPKVLTASTLSDNTWTASSSGSASTASNWQNGTLTANQNIFFSNAGTGSCTWDVSGTFGYFHMNTGYTGTITATVNLNVSGFYLASGTFTGNGIILTDSSDFICGISGSVGTINLVMAGNGNTFSTGRAFGLTGIRFSGNTTVAGGNGLYVSINGGTFVVDSGVTVTNNLGNYSYPTMSYAGFVLVDTTSFTNSGQITGSQPIEFARRASDTSNLVLGTMSAPVVFLADLSSAANRTISIGAASNLGGTALVVSTHASYTMTLNLNGYSLSCSALTIGSLGIISGSGTVTVSGAFTQNGASSQVTMGGNWSVGSFSMSAGTFTGNTANLVTLYGSLTYSGGTIGSGTTNYQMMTDGSTFKWTGANAFGSFQASANVTITTFTLATEIASNKNIIVDAGKTLTIASGVTLRFSTWPAGATFTNNGVIAGPGTMAFDFYNADKTLIIEIINAPVKFELESGATGSYKETLMTNTAFGSTLTIVSSHASNTMTLDLSTSNYSLSATDITIGTRGILLGRASSITCSGSWDSSAGSFVQGTSTLHLTGSGKTLKRATGQAFYWLSVDAGANYTMLSNITTNYYFQGGALVKNGYSLYINHDRPPVFTTTSPPLLTNESDSYIYPISAYDPENISTVTYSLHVGPSWLAVNPTTGTISGIAATSSQGTYQISVASSDGNNTAYLNWTLVVGPYQGGAGSIIQASFRFSLDGNQLWYESTSYGNISSVIWNFGDTSGSTSLSGTHEYTKAGTYQLTLIVYDADGKSSMAQTTLVVALSAAAPVLRNAQGTGWDVYLWPGATLQISVLFLLIVGSVLIGMAKILNGKKSHRIITKKGKVFIGTVMILLALYIIFFFSSPIPPLSFGW